MKHDDSRLRRAKMGEQMAEWGRQWALEADMVRCPFCHSVQTASHADRSFVHDPGCRAVAAGDQYPWRALAWILREL